MGKEQVFNEQPRCREIGLLLLPGVSTMALGGLISPMREANALRGKQLYRWHLLSSDDQPVRSDSGLMLAPDTGRRAAPLLDALVVCGGDQIPDWRGEKRLQRWLRRLGDQNVPLGCIGTGSFMLAAAGLLNGHRCSVHWEYNGSFGELFPGVITTQTLYEDDGQRFSCAGGTAALDMMLQRVRGDHDDHLAQAICEQLLCDDIRDRERHQRPSLPQRLGAHHPTLVDAIELMESNLAEPLDQAELAQHLDASPRHLQRLFRRHLHTCPMHYYMRIRLEHARRLLRQTSLSIAEVGCACGFSSSSHFSSRYRQHFGQSPSADRQQVIGCTVVEMTPLAKELLPANSWSEAGLAAAL